LAALLVGLCAGCGVNTPAPPAPTAVPVVSAPPTPAPPPSPSPSPLAAVKPPSPSPVAAQSPAATAPPKPATEVAKTLPTVEASRPSTSASFLTAIDLELEFAEPIANPDELRRVVQGMLELNGVVHVSSDGVHISLRYDSGMVLPARMREQLQELGHPARAGTEIQSPGDTAD